MKSKCTRSSMPSFFSCSTTEPRLDRRISGYVLSCAMRGQRRMNERPLSAHTSLICQHQQKGCLTLKNPLGCTAWRERISPLRWRGASPQVHLSPRGWFVSSSVGSDKSFDLESCTLGLRGVKRPVGPVGTYRPPYFSPAFLSCKPFLCKGGNTSPGAFARPDPPAAGPMPC